MSLFAGAFVRRTDRYPASKVLALADALQQRLSRHPEDRVQVFRSERACIASVGIGAIGRPQFQVDPGGAVTALAGEPLLSGAESATASGLLDLHESLLSADWGRLETASGVFAAAQFDPKHDTLTLLTDKLGIRPVYVWQDDDVVVFATALRVLEDVPQVVKSVDLRGVCEVAAFGYALADRTPYVGIRRLLPAERLTVSTDRSGSVRYWRWDVIREATRSVSDHLALVNDTFSTAVRRRLGSDGAAAAYLSGGLDSRTLVASLTALGPKVFTFNFSHPGSQDQVFGARFAEAAGTCHREVARRPDDGTDWSAMMASALEQSFHKSGSEAERPRSVWSGDGGSVVAGHVYLSPAIVEAMRRGDIEAAVDLYTNKWQVGITPRILAKEFAGAMMEVPRVGIREELELLDCEDRGRAFHLFMLFNDQRRHLDRHFEDVDLHRLEFELPFFDSGFVAAVLSLPLDLCLRHVMYHRWLELLPDFVRSVPWQTYPDHEPCPLPVPDDLEYQWGGESPPAFEEQRRRNRLAETARLLRATDFPREILDRWTLSQAFWAYRLKFRDCGYLLDKASLYYRHWERAGGSASLTPLAEPTSRPKHIQHR
jgi:asparagine synthase (glutamine-hydrolysing)